jgi:hypothetical protein
LVALAFSATIVADGVVMLPEAFKPVDAACRLPKSPANVRLNAGTGAWAPVATPFCAEVAAPVPLISVNWPTTTGIPPAVLTGGGAEVEVVVVPGIAVLVALFAVFVALPSVIVALPAEFVGLAAVSVGLAALLVGLAAVLVGLPAELVGGFAVVATAAPEEPVVLLTAPPAVEFVGTVESGRLTGTPPVKIATPGWMGLPWTDALPIVNIPPATKAPTSATGIGLRT